MTRREKYEEGKNIDLWPRQQPSKTHQHNNGSFKLFPRRDPFKEVAKEDDLPNGHYITRSFTTKSHVGADGKVVTERYASSAVGNGRERIHEAKHLYSNSSSDVEKASHEQHIRGRSRMATTEYAKGERLGSNQIFHGMNATENEAFDQDFDMSTKHLPDRSRLSREALKQPPYSFHRRRPALGYGNSVIADLFDLH
jgi:hypothetical protein